MKRKKTIKDLIKEKQETQNIKQKYNIDKEAKIVIEKKNIFVQVLQFLETSLFKIIKIIFLIAIAILSSIGLTVLLNEPLRNLFLELIPKNFF